MDLAHGLLCIAVDILTQKWKQRGLPMPEYIGGNVTGQVIIVTGPTSGIGEQVAANLARRGAVVILACRNVAKGQALKAKLEGLARKAVRKEPNLEVQELDVSSFASIRSFAKKWAESGRKLDCLVNNAGIMSIGEKRRLQTADGIEAHMSTNYLGPFLLTLLLLPALERAGRPEQPARVVMVSSIVHNCCNGLARDNMNLERTFSALRAYGLSKNAQVTMVAELRRRLPQDGRIAVFACHPGEASTDIVRTLPPLLRRLNDFVMPSLLISVEKAGLSTLLCATSNPVTAKLDHMDPGKPFIGCGCSIEEPASGCTDPIEGAWLWDWSSKVVKLESSAQLLRQ